MPEEAPDQEEEQVVAIPLSLLYRLADDSPLGGLWGTLSIEEKLRDLLGEGELCLK